jgi:hypothetical protein
VHVKTYRHGIKDVYVPCKPVSLQSLLPKDIIREYPDEVELDVSGACFHHDDRVTPSRDSQKDAYDSLNRARKTVFDLAVSNNWDFFVTLTFATNRTDVLEKYAIVRSEIKRLTRSFPGFRAIFIPEYHKKVESDGRRAVHFHGLISGLPASEFGKRARTRKGYCMPWLRFTKYGFTSVSQVKNDKAVAGYLCKYITKDVIRPMKHCPSYISTRRLARPARHKYHAPVGFAMALSHKLAHDSLVYHGFAGSTYTSHDCPLSDVEFFGELMPFLVGFD